MNNHLNTRLVVLKGLNLNNPVRSAGERAPYQTTALKGLNINAPKFSPFRAATIPRFCPCVSRTVIQIQHLAEQLNQKLFNMMFGRKTVVDFVEIQSY